MSLLNLFLPLSLLTFIIAVFLSKNPVYGVLSFVAVILHVVALLIVLDLEFLAYVLAIVYIGAIVVLFLFVIMMFYIYQSKVSRSVVRGSIEYFTLGWVATNIAYYCAFFDINEYVDYTSLVFNTNLLFPVSWYLFNDGLILTILAALLMLVSIVGAVIITIKPAEQTKFVIQNRSHIKDVLILKK